MRICFRSRAEIRYVIRPLRPVRITPEEFEYERFTLKTHQLFSVHTTSEEFQNATITGQFGFVFEETSVREIT